ncbi:MAG: hypothetical protein AB7F19_06780 [Candidatus Babeliales bacterium]
MKKALLFLMVAALLIVGLLKITRAFNVEHKIKQDVKPWLVQSQDNRDPKDVNSSAESRKRRREDQLQR